MMDYLVDPDDITDFDLNDGAASRHAFLGLRRRKEGKDGRRQFGQASRTEGTSLARRTLLI